MKPGTVLLDTNVLVRYLTNDDASKAADVQELIQQAVNGHIELWVPDVAFAELAWTLGSYYSLPRAELAQKLVAVLNTPGLVFQDAKLLVDAVTRYASYNVDYIDAYLAAVAAQQGIRVCSYDRDFNHWPEIKRVEPRALIART